MIAIVWYLAPLVPAVVRTFLVVRHRRLMKDPLSEEESDRETHRSIVLALAGFSFTGLLALAVLDRTLRQDYRVPIFYLLISFLSYLCALNLQGYKLFRWLDQLSNALIETASLGLVLAVVHTISVVRAGRTFEALVFCLALLVWAVDFLIRIRLDHRYLAKLGGTRARQPREVREEAG